MRGLERGDLIAFVLRRSAEMDEGTQSPIAQRAYDALAEAYAALVDTKPHNAYYERPATLSLLPEVRGKRVLDAGCGPGVYSEWLADRGAEVVAFDANERMVRLARERLGTKAQVVRAELGQPLDFLADASFDIVVGPLVLDYVRDWRAVFEEFYRVLRQGGLLIFSMEHPFAKFYDHQEGGNYFETELVEYEWRGFGAPVRVPSYRRPMGEVINPLVGAGFVLERLLEPIPTEKFRERSPEDYEELRKRPGFMCVRAAKRRT
jgi:SAM-dependent methyltransferase